MTRIYISLTSTQASALSMAVGDSSFWSNSLVIGRANAAIDEIASRERERLTSAGLPAPANKEDLISSAAEFAGRPKPASTMAEYKSAFDSLLDAVAQEMNYDNRFSPPSYLGSTNTQWAAEAAVYVEWRDRAMEYMFAQLIAFQSGEAQPTIAEFIAGIPKIEWPISE